MYQINGLLKFAEEDIYEEGCIPSISQTYEVDFNFEDATISGVIEEAREYLDCPKECIELDACDDGGRVDFAIYETEDGLRADETDFSLWKKGKRRLWLCTYSAIVEKVERVETCKVGD
jgi:hypothetical protein